MQGELIGMGGEACELCGHMTKAGAIEMHHVVPQEITRQAGVSDSATTRLCHNCHQELHTWYSKRVFNMAYDPKTKRFGPKPPAQMLKEYAAAYGAFAEYKKRQPKRV